MATWPSAAYQLIRQKENGLERKLAVAEVEQIFERRPEQIDDHRIIIALCSEPANERYTDSSSEGLVDLGFVLELGVLRLDRLEFDRDLLARDDVDAEVDITCTRRSA